MIRARKRFGQHFLEPAWVDKLIRAIDPKADQTFIEIGPGRGALTRPLAARAKAVIAHEIDRDLARELREAAISNVTVVQGDFLETFPSIAQSPINSESPITSESPIASESPITSESPFTTHPNPQSPIPNHPVVRVAGNLPYNVASPIMFKLVDAYLEGVPLVDATLMLQLEVAERLVAQAGTKTYGVLSVLIGHCARVDLLLKLPPGAFRPPPKVRSAVVRLTFHPPDPPVRDRKTFEQLVQAVFTHRRKTLANALRSWEAGDLTPDQIGGQIQGQIGSQIRGLSLDLSRRPETLTVAEFAALADVFSSP